MISFLLLVAILVEASHAWIHAMEVPQICATYFNFTNTNQSNTFYGVLNEETGTFRTKSNLGYRFDPQGRIAIGMDSFSFTVTGNKTADEGFVGCCDEYSILTVNKTTGSFEIASMDPKSPFGPGSEQCGKYGCGIMQLASLDDDNMIVWIEPQIPPAPPTTTTTNTTSTKSNPNLEGLSLGTFDVHTYAFSLLFFFALVHTHTHTHNSGIINPIRPFVVNLENTNATTPMDAGMTAYDRVQKNFWFACNPRGNFDVEGVCAYPATKSNETSAEMTVLEFPTKTYTINSIGFSEALKGVVVLAQTYNATSALQLQSTKLFFADPSKPNAKEWDIIVDLGDARNSLHQGTISPCGRFYIVALEVGTKNEKYPAQDVVMIDLVKKTILKRVHAQHTEIDISVLSAFTCM